MSNEVIKPAAKGNLKPLSRLLASLPLGYALYESKRLINGRPEETDPKKRALATFQNVGGAGLAFDLYQGLNPPNSKYTPTDRRVSMALGTFGGPTLGLAAQTAGAVSDLVQRKTTPSDPSRLDGRVTIAKNDKTYTDASQAARLGLSQIPIIGGPIKNRVLPYKAQANADAGYADSPKPSHGSPFEALGQVFDKLTGKKAVSADSLTPDQAIAKVKADNKTAQVNYKATLSKSDYQLSTLNKQERQSLIDQKVVTADKFKGLDNYTAAQKLKLGLTSPKAADPNYTSPAAEYKAMQTAYDTKIKNGSYNSDAQRIKAENSLQTAKIGSTYDKSTRDLYGLTKQEAYTYLSGKFWHS